MAQDEETETWRWDDERARLIAVWNDGLVSRPLPDRGSLSLGRGAECDVCIDHPSVSRVHAVLRIEQGHLAIEDVGSSNGTRVAGAVVAAHVAVPLKPDDVVELGAARIVVQAAPGVAAAARSRGAPARSESSTDRLDRLVQLAAPSDISVILHGETGVGKDVVAGRLHELSPRASKPFVRINCAALSDSLLASELFGHEQGAFTGAVHAKPGLLEAASGGTFLLDEVAELPLATQAKLLRVLEDREVLRVGGLKPRRIDVRFVAATNRDLRDLCERGLFRSDLYFRLNGFTITIPPLRERVHEIPALVRVLVERRCRAASRIPPRLSDAALRTLQGHPWPGNVRELKNVVDRALLLCSGEEIRPEHVSFDAPLRSAAPDSERQAPVSGPPSSTRLLRDEVDALERDRIIGALDQCGGNQTKAARMLGMSRRTLLSRLDAWGLPRPRK